MMLADATECYHDGRARKEDDEVGEKKSAL